MRYEHALRNVRSIDWSIVGARIDELHCRQFIRFMHRAAALAAPFSVRLSRPLFVEPGVFGFVVPRLPESDTSFLVDTPAIQSYPIVRLAVTNHLRLCAAVDSSSDLPGSAAEVYLPLLDLFADGGMIDTHHHEIIVDGRWACSVQKWQERYLGPEPEYE